MQITIEKITPAIAAAYLDSSNTANRPMRPQHVRALASDMRAGLWQTTHEPVAFAEDGVLIDGQHRLAAIAQSGKTIEIAVARGCKRGTFHVVGCGATRTAGDTLSIAGETCSRRLASAVSAAITGESRNTVSRAAIIEFLRGPRGDLCRALAGKNVHSRVLGALVRAVDAGVIDESAAITFADRFQSGDWNGSDDPVCRLRMLSDKLHGVGVYPYAVTAIRAFSEGKQIKQIKKSIDFVA